MQIRNPEAQPHLSTDTFAKNLAHYVLECQLGRKDIRGWLTGHEHIHLLVGSSKKDL